MEVSYTKFSIDFNRMQSILSAYQCLGLSIYIFVIQLRIFKKHTLVKLLLSLVLIVHQVNWWTMYWTNWILIMLLLVYYSICILSAFNFLFFNQQEIHSQTEQLNILWHQWMSLNLWCPWQFHLYLKILEDKYTIFSPKNSVCL